MNCLSDATANQSGLKDYKEWSDKTGFFVHLLCHILQRDKWYVDEVFLYERKKSI